MASLRHLLAAIPFDPRSRRAIDETLLDWEAEAGRTTSPMRRWLLDVRTLVALARVLFVASLRTCRTTPWATTAVRMAVCLCPLALTLAFRARLFERVQHLPVRYWPESLAALALTSSILIVPLAAFYAAATWPVSRPVPRTGLLAVAVAFVLCAARLGGAASWHVQTISTDYILFERGYREPGPIGLVDLGLADAAGRVVTGAWQALTPGGAATLVNPRTMVFLVAMAIMSVLWLVIGTGVRRRARSVRWGWYVAAPVFYALAVFASQRVASESLTLIRMWFSGRELLVLFLVIVGGLALGSPVGLIRLSRLGPERRDAPDVRSPAPSIPTR
ncbi:MAG: hypothetical protein R2752_10170 [Vicinamibacterales bacterium]